MDRFSYLRTLWVPQSGNTPGHVTWYFDGHAESSIYWLGPATSTSLPGLSTDYVHAVHERTGRVNLFDSRQRPARPLTANRLKLADVRRLRTGLAARLGVHLDRRADGRLILARQRHSEGDGITNTTKLTLDRHGRRKQHGECLRWGEAGSAPRRREQWSGTWSFTTSDADEWKPQFSRQPTRTRQDGRSAASAALAVIVDTVAAGGEGEPGARYRVIVDRQDYLE